MEAAIAAMTKHVDQNRDGFNHLENPQNTWIAFDVAPSSVGGKGNTEFHSTVKLFREKGIIEKGTLAQGEQKDPAHHIVVRK